MEIDRLKQLINNLVNEKYVQERRVISAVIVSKFKSQQQQIQELKKEKDYHKNLSEKLNKLHDKAVNECTDLKVERTKLEERLKELEDILKESLIAILHLVGGSMAFKPLCKSIEKLLTK